MRLSSLISLATGALLALGCGGSNPGGGTRTLFVKAEAVSDGSTDGSWMAVEVRDSSSSGNLITDAVVIIRGDKSGELSLPWQGLKWGSFTAGSYYKAQLPWDSGWRLEVRRGNDRLDAFLEAPGLSTITEPIAGTTFRRADAKPLVIRWKDSFDRRARTVRVRLDRAEVDTTSLEDRLLQEVEPNRLVVEDKERISLTRSNEIELAGGIPGSTFKASTTHRIEFKVE